MSISGGLNKAVLRGKMAGCQVVQIFTRNATRWTSKKINSCERDAFLQAQAGASIEVVSAHGSYLINLASPRADLREKSRKALMEEIARAALLGVPFVVMHPGAHMGAGEHKGISRIVDGLNRVLDGTAGCPVKILLETTAGQGTQLGWRFEHLAEILERLEDRDRMGVCLDTCHLFAAGYDFRSATAYGAMMSAFDKAVGLSYVEMLHMNDSKGSLGSRVDRHEHLGRGRIGRKGFALFLCDKAFRRHPFVIETPKGFHRKGTDWDVANLAFLRRLAEKDTSDDRL